MPAKKASKEGWSFKPYSKNVHQIDVYLPNVGEEQWLLLQSDVHWDNPKCDRKMLHKHWQQALEFDAPILDDGDFFCAMQGKYDPRKAKKDIRPEHNVNHYLDALVDTAAEEMEPYLSQFTVRSDGNHETNILKRQETDLNDRLAKELRRMGGMAVAGKYTGWIKVVVHYQGGTARRSFVIWRNHGWGGGGPVTKGVIDHNRSGVYIHDADVMWTGHTHDMWILPVETLRLNRQSMAIERRRVYHVRTPGYKDDYGDGLGGWHVERGAPPKPNGALWMNICYESRKEGPMISFQEAK